MLFGNKDQHDKSNYSFTHFLRLTNVDFISLFVTEVTPHIVYAISAPNENYYENVKIEFRTSFKTVTLKGTYERVETVE